MTEIISCPKCFNKIISTDPRPACRCFASWKEFDEYYWNQVRFTEEELKDYEEYVRTYVKGE